MTSDEINGALGKLDNADMAVPGLGDSGKVVPYYGWFWRRVDFDQPITFAHPGAAAGGFDVPAWVGFCENNKWDYPEFVATEEQSAEVRRLAEQLATEATVENAQALFDFIQTLKP